MPDLPSPSPAASVAHIADPCILVIFGASGDLTKRLLMPALFNLACDGLLPDRFAIVGMAMDDLTIEQFRERMTESIEKFNTRNEFDSAAWTRFRERLHYTSGRFDDAAAFQQLAKAVEKLDLEFRTGGNVLFYMATPPTVFGLVSNQLQQAGFATLGGWKRIIVEKPFGHDLGSARALNQEILQHWEESQVYRIDHYLGKETVQNILAFRFANEIYEPLWNHRHIDHIQFSVAESVSVEGRGGYYDKAGVLRDMIQNHMFQMLAYLCMEAPKSFAADDVRDAKADLLNAVRRFNADEAMKNSIRGQYGPGRKTDGKDSPAYREELGVDRCSTTETFAALRLFIDNERWQGVPVYLRSGKALWKRGTEIVVQFKRPTANLFGKNPPANRLIFHIQPDQAIETLLQAKTPGPLMQLQPVNMRFGYGESFRASRGTGYEIMLFNCMCGDQTLFSRSDLVESAWAIAQPILDAWAATTPIDFPNYPAGTWGPKAAYDLLANEGRRWFEVVNREILDRVPLFHGGDPLLLNQVSMAMRPRAAAAGDTIVREGEPGQEMFIICRGELEAVNSRGEVLREMKEGDCFGEIALLLSEKRTATVRAKTACDLFTIDRTHFAQVLNDHEQFAKAVRQVAKERYGRVV